MDSKKIEAAFASEDHARGEVKRLKSIINHREKTIELLRKRLSEQKAVTFKPPKKRKGRRGKSRAIVRTISTDVHGAKMDRAAVNAFLDDYERLQPAEHIDLGDLVDCGGFLAQHHTLGYVAETAYTYSDDIAAANWFLDQLQTRSPGTKIVALEGNHEQRVEKWCITQAQAKGAEAQLLLDVLAPWSLLSVADRGIEYIRRGTRYDDLAIPGTIRRGKCYFTHGDGAAKHQAANMVSKYGGNVVYGHTHRADSFSIRTVTEGTIAAWNPGCLCELQPLWRHTKMTDWTHGYGLQLVQPSGEFLHINVPIIDGVSYLSDFIEVIQ